MIAHNSLSLRVEASDSAASRALQEAFFDDISSRYPDWEPAASKGVEPSQLAPPAGVWLVAYLGDRAVGCGGLQPDGLATAQVRRLFLDSAVRGQGVGRALLAELEAHARRIGYERVRLTTGASQPEALALFRRAGYAETAPFTNGAFTRHWLEKALD